MDDPPSPSCSQLLENAVDYWDEELDDEDDIKHDDHFEFNPIHEDFAGLCDYCGCGIHCTKATTNKSANKMTEVSNNSDNKIRPFAIFKYVYSTCLLLFCVVIVMALIFTENTRISRQVHPALAFGVIVLSLIWLNLVEGTQGAFVGLPPVNRNLYKTSHCITYKCTSLCHKGDNLDRYLMGRQFLVLLIVFVTNLSGAPLEDLVGFWDLPQWVIDVFLRSGIAMILMTAMMGQLNSQVNASHCMLDYVNNYLALGTLYVSLIIEFSGLLHASYGLQISVAKLAGKPIESQEPPRTLLQNIFFWGRVLLSLTITAFGLAVTLQALFDGKTTMWEGVPAWVAVILFFFFLMVIGMLEGMQIAFFAVTKLPKSEQGDHPWAKRTCKLLFAKGGRNLPGFMIGRQICVTMCFFFVARVTTMNVEVGVDDNVFGVSDATQEFFNTGLLAAVVTTIIGSIAWQLVASAFPISFLSFPPVYILLRLCLLLETTGICSGAWVLAMIHKRIAHFQVDETYIGTPEDRAAQNLEDRPEERHIEPGRIRKIGYTPGRHEMSGKNWDDTDLDLEGAMEDDDVDEESGSDTDTAANSKKGQGDSTTTTTKETEQQPF